MGGPHYSQKWLSRLIWNWFSGNDDKGSSARTRSAEKPLFCKRARYLTTIDEKS